MTPSGKSTRATPAPPLRIHRKESIYRLGAIVEKLRCVNPDMVATALKETISERKAALLDLNLKAVEAGREFIRGQKA